MKPFIPGRPKSPPLELPEASTETPEASTETPEASTEIPIEDENMGDGPPRRSRVWNLSAAAVLALLFCYKNRGSLEKIFRHQADGDEVLAMLEKALDKAKKGHEAYKEKKLPLFAGSGPLNVAWKVEMEIAAYNLALRIIREWN